uniref:Protein kinase domain-containing protein n=1 Tax=Leersia perrieri TaxID=77586 RepID=A0A0D9W7K3_9ORYZ
MTMAGLLGVSLLVAGLGCVLLVAPSESAADDVAALLAFKKAIFEDPLAKLSDWNSKDEDPCAWTGVGCSPFDSRVVTLELANSSLKGFLALEIESLSSLQKLILDQNTLMGSIPKGIGKLRDLIVLNLSTNQLVGSIPSEIGDMPKISKIDLHANRLDGAVPPELGKLTSLTELRLSNNSLTGTIPGSNDSSMLSTNSDGQTGLCLLTQLTDMDLSYNYFVGDVPKCFKQIQRRCKARSSGNSATWTRATSWKENTVISIDDDLLGNVPKISRQELAEACEDFSNIIGSSHDTVVYKGTMKDGNEIAVVSLSASVVEMSRLNHENVAKMVGYSKESDPFLRMLVFQYPPNGTLYEHLRDGEGCQLSWPRRMKIALSIARALRYLHTEMQPPFAVAALTSSSVYLTEDFSPKIIDFERWRALLTKPGLSSGSIVNGSFNNIMDSRHMRFMDVQANTFAFGVILLELISGRASLSKDTVDLVDWARKHLDQTEEFVKLVDPKLRNTNHDNLGIICNVVNLCIDPEPCRRPSMNMITAILEEGIDTSPATVLRASSLAWAEAEIAIS